MAASRCAAASSFANRSAAAASAAASAAAVSSFGSVPFIAEPLAWERAAIEIASGGTVFVANHDRVRHTFMVEELGIEAGLPPGTPRRVAIGDAAPGEYELICSVPGHEGMTGTRTVTG
jgi:plastocyanin